MKVAATGAYACCRATQVPQNSKPRKYNNSKNTSREASKINKQKHKQKNKNTNHNNTIANNLRLLHQPNGRQRSTCTTTTATITASCLWPQRVSHIWLELNWWQAQLASVFGRPKQIFARSRMPRVNNENKVQCRRSQEQKDNKSEIRNQMKL